MKLYAPKQYWRLDKAELVKITNGCGPAGWKVQFIPDRLLFISIKEACDIHDFMYFIGATEADREEADRVFLNNMLRIVEAKSGNFLTRWARRRLALYYYGAVRDYGSVYFWEGKNEEDAYVETGQIKT